MRAAEVRAPATCCFALASEIGSERPALARQEDRRQMNCFVPACAPCDDSPDSDSCKKGPQIVLLLSFAALGQVWLRDVPMTIPRASRLTPLPAPPSDTLRYGRPFSLSP
jgi:hypothetical protein